MSIKKKNKPSKVLLPYELAANYQKQLVETTRRVMSAQTDCNLEHGLWRNGGVPHQGWTSDGATDVRGDTPVDDTHCKTCEMCGHYPIRFVHRMWHQEHRHLDVGCVCAEHMSGDYVGPRCREKELMKKASRRTRWMDKDWKISEKGDPWIKIKGYHFVLWPDRTRAGFYRLIENGVVAEGSFKSVKKAKLAAFDAVERDRGKGPMKLTADIIRATKLEPEIVARMALDLDYCDPNYPPPKNAQDLAARIHRKYMREMDWRRRSQPDEVWNDPNAAAALNLLTHPAQVAPLVESMHIPDVPDDDNILRVLDWLESFDDWLCPELPDVTLWCRQCCRYPHFSREYTDGDPDFGSNIASRSCPVCVENLMRPAYAAESIAQAAYEAR